MDASQKPLVYSCSGCSSAAQLANQLAIRLDRSGLAEMSCIAGIGGNVRSIVRKAREAVETGRAIVAIDGCILACTRCALAQRGVMDVHHVQLGEAGVRKHHHQDYEPAQLDTMYEVLSEQIVALATEGGKA